MLLEDSTVPSVEASEAPVPERAAAAEEVGAALEVVVGVAFVLVVEVVEVVALVLVVEVVDLVVVVLVVEALVVVVVVPVEPPPMTLKCHWMLWVRPKAGR